MTGTDAELAEALKAASESHVAPVGEWRVPWVWLPGETTFRDWDGPDPVRECPT